MHSKGTRTHGEKMDGANCLCEWKSGMLKEFVAFMNHKYKQNGSENTNNKQCLLRFYVCLHLFCAVFRKQ